MLPLNFLKMGYFSTEFFSQKFRIFARKFSDKKKIYGKNQNLDLR